ncbi:hypothetical protein C8R46DRAFT_1224899 [Mycena filopes]|nr:hypothetical protein C8R46DRAFT_1224899 [Mycena filopes]
MSPTLPLAVLAAPPLRSEAALRNNILAAGVGGDEMAMSPAITPRVYHYKHGHCHHLGPLAHPPHAPTTPMAASRRQETHIHENPKTKKKKNPSKIEQKPPSPATNWPTAENPAASVQFLARRENPSCACPNPRPAA